MRITLLDNFDSFTYNLVEQFCLLGAEVRVMRNDTPLPTIQAALLADGCELLVLSPGPGRPEDAGCMLELLAWARGRLPVLGVCLGHQALALAAGGAVGEARKPLHGKSTSLRFDQRHPLFDGIADLRVARYHSLVVKRESLPECLEITAWTQHADGSLDEIMGVRHKTLNVEGVQFHPESILTEQGHELLANFLRQQGGVRGEGN